MPSHIISKPSFIQEEPKAATITQIKEGGKKKSPKKQKPIIYSKSRSKLKSTKLHTNMNRHIERYVASRRRRETLLGTENDGWVTGDNANAQIPPLLPWIRTVLWLIIMKIEGHHCQRNTHFFLPKIQISLSLSSYFMLMDPIML